MLARTKKAFTLIELIAVVVVLGILAALAVPTFNTVKNNSAKEVVSRSADTIMSNAFALAAFNETGQGVTSATNIADAVAEAGLNASYVWSANTTGGTLAFTKNGETYTATLVEGSSSDQNGSVTVAP
jgi:type IV pilus assembly protein PilA